MRRVLLLVALAALLPLAQADECIPTTSRTSTQTIVVETGLQTALFLTYVVFDVCQPDCLWSIWQYEETNGMSGLQRFDEVRDDTCGGRIAGDRWFF